MKSTAPPPWGTLPTPQNPADQTIDASAMFETIERMIIEACGDRFAIQAVAAAGIGEDGILVDIAHRPLVPAMAWFDPRRTEIFDQLAPKLPAAERTGVATEPSRTLTGWAWARAQPGAEKASAWIAVTDYAACRWSQTNFMSDTLAARTAAFDVERREWISERVAIALGSPELLPPVRRAGDIVGPLRSARLQEAGLLRSDAVVVVGGHDHPVGGWGVHQMHPGAILDSMGTAEVVVAQSPDPHVAGRSQLDISPGIRSAGTTLLRVEELSRNVYWASEDKAVGEALRQITAGAIDPDSYFESRCFVPGGQGGIAPYFTGEAPIEPLSRASAVVGALARLGAGAVQVVADQMPANAAIYVAGGWARAPGWLDAKRAVSANGFRVVAEPEVTAVGAALLAAAGAGWKVSAEQALTPSELPVQGATERRVKRFWTGDAK